MKKLTKIRLINWHYLANETINVKNNVLLTGPNASGKSTILDAITYVITAGDTQFNLAANEKGKRDLRGYIKCKLGLEAPCRTPHFARQCPGNPIGWYIPYIVAGIYPPSALFPW